jgi:hypothetical protein
VIGAEGPGGFEHFKPFFGLDTQVVLFHGLQLIASAFPHSTVAIIKDMKSLLIWKLGLCFDVAHANNFPSGFLEILHFTQVISLSLLMRLKKNIAKSKVFHYNYFCCHLLL